MKYYTDDEIKLILKEKTTKEILGNWKYVEKCDFAEDLPALVYDFDFYILIEKDYYYLILERDDYISEDLCYLEELLAEYKLMIGVPPSQ